MDDRRRHNRYQPKTKLSIYNVSTDENLGYVINLSTQGFMICCKTPNITNTTMACRLVNTGSSFNKTINITFNAICLWHQFSADEKHCWAGFRIQESDSIKTSELNELISQL